MAKATQEPCAHCGGKLSPGKPFCKECGHPTRWATHQERTSWEVTQWRAASIPPLESRRKAPEKSGSKIRGWFSRSKPAAPSAPLSLVQPRVTTPAVSTSESTYFVDITDAAVAPVEVSASAATPPIEASTAPATFTRKPVKQLPRSQRTPPKPDAPIADPKPIAPKKAETVAPPSAAAEPAPPAVEAEAPQAAPARPEPELAPGPSDDQPPTDTPVIIRALRLLNMRVAELDADVRRLQSELDRHRSGEEQRDESRA